MDEISEGCMVLPPIKYEFNIEVEPLISDRTYPHNLQLYDIPPSGCINADELQKWCVNRLKVLKLVEQISQHSYKNTAKECLSILIKELEDIGLVEFLNLLNEPDSLSETETKQQTLRRNDCMSHFILRSAFAFEFEKRYWFVNQEVKLFKWRCSVLNKESIIAFNCINGLHYVSISEDEKQSIIEDLSASCPDVEDVNNTTFYKVHFTYVPGLIKNRKVFLKGGTAYVPETNMSWLILAEFKRRLNESFACARQVASNVYNDERLIPIFSQLPKCVKLRYLKYTTHRRVSVGELDELSRTSYPLCMKVAHDALKTNHHLTNGGRIQYGLFLKGLGLSLDESLKFWKGEFVKAIDESVFEREYKYTIRHLYGREGRHANYEPFNCFKIMNTATGPRDNHGCPFKCMTIDLLRETLHECGLVRPDIESIIKLSTEGYYSGACKKYYESTHNRLIEKSFRHPNIYFNRSFKMISCTNSDSEDCDV